MTENTIEEPSVDLKAKEPNLQELFEIETGKNAVWHGKLTKQFKEWRKEFKKRKAKIPIENKEKVKKEKVKKEKENTKFTSRRQSWWFQTPHLEDLKDGYVKFHRGYPKYLSILKKYCTPEKIGHFDKIKSQWVFIHEAYKAPKTDAEKALQELVELQNEGKARYNNCPPIFKLIDKLRRLFNRNLQAKINSTRSGRSRAYIDKNSILRSAVNLAATIKLPFFKYGLGIDDECIGYEVVVYFKIGDKQISFHTDNVTTGPEFEEGWDGIVNNSYPFSVSYVKKLMKEHNVSWKDLFDMNFQIPEAKIVDYSDAISDKREYRRRRRRFGDFWDDDFDDWVDDFNDWDDDFDDWDDDFDDFEHGRGRWRW